MFTSSKPFRALLSDSLLFSQSKKPLCFYWAHMIRSDPLSIVFLLPYNITSSWVWYRITLRGSTHTQRGGGTPLLIILCRCCIFYKLRICGHPASSKSIGTIFLTAFAHFMSLCHILVILTVFQTFSLLFYLLWHLWSVIFGVTIVISFGVPWTTPVQNGELNW